MRFNPIGIIIIQRHFCFIRILAPELEILKICGHVNDNNIKCLFGQTATWTWMHENIY